jgi:hypothetical protein
MRGGEVMTQEVVIKEYTVDGLDLRRNEATGQQVAVLRAHSSTEAVECVLADAGWSSKAT